MISKHCGHMFSEIKSTDVYQGEEKAAVHRDVIYQFSDIKGIEDIKRRGIAKDLLCHLLGYAKAYSIATSKDNNPLNYISHSGHVFEVAAVNGLMDIVEAISPDCVTLLSELFALLRDHTDDMMLAAESHSLGLFFFEHEKRQTTINRLIRKVVKLLCEHASLDMQRIEDICQDSLAKNDPEIRIRRLLKSTKK